MFYSQTSSVKWILSGIGIHPNPNVSLVTETDWDQLFSYRSQDIPTFNGYFAGIQLENEKLELLNDQILDLLSPSAIVNKHCYSTDKVNSLLSSFYEDRDNDATIAVNGLLNFELLQRELSNKVIDQKPKYTKKGIAKS